MLQPPRKAKATSRRASRRLSERNAANRSRPQRRNKLLNAPSLPREGRARFQQGGIFTDFEKHAFLQSGTAKIHYYECGNGPPLVLLHGNSESKSCFEKQLPAFTGLFRCVIIESRGHGSSTHGSERLSLSLMADDVFAVMDALNIKTSHILGFSDGGNIAIHMALKARERVSSLVLSGANSEPSGLSPGGMALIKLTQQLLRAGSLFSTAIKRRLEIWELMVYEPSFTENELRSIKIPTLITAGERDIILREHTEYLHRCIDNSELKIFKGGDHHVNSKLSGPYNETVCNFLNKQEVI